MIALIQRVTQARVDVAGETVGSIGPGLLALIGIQPADTLHNVNAWSNACWPTASSRMTADA